MYIDRNSIKAFQEHRIVEMQRAAPRRHRSQDGNRPADQSPQWWRRMTSAWARPRQA